MLAGAVAVWIFVRYPDVLVSNVLNPDIKGHVDFETFYRSSVALLHGTDTYRTGALLPNLNPPLLALLLAPFGLLPALSAYWAFTVLSLLAMTAAVVLVARELRLAAGWILLGVGTLWASSPLHGTLVLGQIYGLLLFGLAFAWLAERKGHPLLGAVVLGVVVALKPSLGPLLLVALVQRQPASLWAGIASAAVATTIGVVAAGPSSALEWVWLASGTPAPEVDANASLPGLVARFGGPGVIGWLLTVLMVAGTLWWIGRATSQEMIAIGPVSMDGTASTTRPVVTGSVRPADAAVFAVTVGCLLAAPIAWLNYTVLLWPGALMLLRAGWWRVGVPLLVLPVIPVAWGNLWLADPHAGISLLGRSLYCLVLLGYWVALAAFVASGSSPSGSPSSQSTPLGGSRRTAEAGRACDGSSTASTAPRLPTPEPP